LLVRVDRRASGVDAWRFRNGLFPGVPWFLDNQRPQGFLGRALGRRVARDVDANTDIAFWSARTGTLRRRTRGGRPGRIVLERVAAHARISASFTHI